MRIKLLDVQIKIRQLVDEVHNADVGAQLGVLPEEVLVKLARYLGHDVPANVPMDFPGLCFVCYHLHHEPGQCGDLNPDADVLEACSCQISAKALDSALRPHPPKEETS